VSIAEFSGHWEGRTVDGVYPLDNFLGGGDDSAVFLTRYESRRAAIKLVPGDPENAEAQLARWRAASKLSHLNLLRILSTGRSEMDGMPLLYVVMDYAEENLAQVLPERPLSTAETRAMLDPTLTALDYIHRQGFVHGHLKPSNVMAVDDQVKLSSDGLRRSSDGDVSIADDLRDLGALLVEVLTQRRPEPGGAAALPQPFSDIAAHCLRSNPADRWSIAQIQQRLDNVSPAPSRKRSYAAPVGALMLLVLLVVLVVGVIVKHSDSAAASAIPKEVAPEPVKAPEPEANKSAPARPSSAAAPTATIPSQSSSSQPDQPMPDITEQARRTIHGRVVIDVTIEADASGTVTDAKLDHPISSKYLSASALQAAHRWRFKPVTVDGRDAPQKWHVRFTLRSTGTEAQPRRISP
jgi:TonB family protein